MKVLEILGFSIGVIAICTGLLLFLMGGLSYRRP